MPTFYHVDALGKLRAGMTLRTEPAGADQMEPMASLLEQLFPGGLAPGGRSVLHQLPVPPYAVDVGVGQLFWQMQGLTKALQVNAAIVVTELTFELVRARLHPPKPSRLGAVWAPTDLEGPVLRNVSPEAK